MKYDVLPLDDRLLGGSIPTSPAARADRREDTGPVRRHGTAAGERVLNIKNKSHSITADIVVPEKAPKACSSRRAADIGGWSLYAKDGTLKYCYNWAASSAS